MKRILILATFIMAAHTMASAQTDADNFYKSGTTVRTLIPFDKLESFFREKLK